MIRVEGNLGQDCPVAAGRDDRKSAALAKHRSAPSKDSTLVQSFAKMREICRSPTARQGMDGAKAFGAGANPDHLPVIFLDGEPHRRRRGAIARYFTPKAITTRYHDVIHRTSDALMAELRETGSAVLDVISFQMAVDVTAEVVGLTNSDSRKQARRLRRMLGSSMTSHRFVLNRVLGTLLAALRAQSFYRNDVAPAVAARRQAPREDVISQMIEENYSKRAMLIECMVYGTAGMITTRELITMAAWHLLDDPSLKQRYIDGDEDDQFAIIEEILRLEPVADALSPGPR
jgi:cytochrome P450